MSLCRTTKSLFTLTAACALGLSACVGVAVPDVLGTAEPVDYAREMGCMVKFGLGWCSNVIEDQTHMPQPPRTVTERQCK